jgi:Sec-independent protein translocase protein TatA
MSTLHAVIVVVFSCLALIIALYCLFFMVPVKRFWERVRTLGGGIKGIEAHVNGVHDSINQQVEELRKETEERADSHREEVDQKLEELGRDDRKTRREVEALKGELKSAQEELHSTAEQLRKAVRNMEALSKRVQQLRTDFDTLDVEVRESVRQQVANSFSTVESTVLSALEAVQEEILYGVTDGDSSEPPRREPPASPSGGGTARRTRDNIITVEPLFGGKGRGEERDAGREKEAPEEEGGD